MIKTRCFTKFNLISITFLLLLAGCSESEVTTQKQNKPRPVKLITLGDESQSKTLTYPATIDTINSSKLAFQVSGKLETLNVIAAQNVKKGDVIAVHTPATLMMCLLLCMKTISGCSSVMCRLVVSTQAT